MLDQKSNCKAIIRGDRQNHTRSPCRPVTHLLSHTSQFHTFQGNHQSLQWNVFAAHVNNFSSNLVQCIDFSGSSGTAVGWSRFFQINNTTAKMFVCPLPKISQVMMKWCRRASHLSRFTLWNSGCGRATQIGRFTLWHYSRLATQLSRFTLWHNGRLAS